LEYESALTNEQRCCPEGLHLDSNVRGKRHALKNGILQGVKPADNVPTSVNRTQTRATPATYVDERNLCLKRRDPNEVKAVETLRPKGHGGWPHLVFIQMRDYPRWMHFLVKQRKSTTNARRIGGSYGSLQHLGLELRNSHTA